MLSETFGLFVLAGLLLLPGLLVVRAPWTAVPFLSASFWIVSWWWLPFLRVGRTRFLAATLAVFAVLAVLRLLKPSEASWPSGPVAVVAGFALARVAPFFLWPVAPGADMSLHSLSTLLMVWRDGIPATYEPLLPIPSFGAYTPGLHGLAADVSLLSGLPAHRSAFLVATVAYALLQVALFALLSRLARPPAAALASVLALGMARVPQAFFGWGGNPSVLALAFLAAAAALLVRGTSRPAATAAGLVLGAAVVSHTMMAAAAVGTLPLVVDLVRRAAPHERPHALRRLGLAGLVALAAAGPFLLRLDFTLSAGESAWLADHLRGPHYAADWARYSQYYALAVLRYVVATMNDAFLAASLAGLALAVRRRLPGLAAAGLSGALLVALAGSARWGGLGPIAFFPERPMALVMVLLAVGFAFLVEDLLARRALAARLVLLVLGGVALERSNRYYLSGAANVMVSGDDLAAMEWIRDHTGPLDVICNDYRTAGLWVPALAGRAISHPQLPPFYFDEFRAGSRDRRCAYTYVSSRWFLGPPEPRALAGRAVFRGGSATIVEGEARGPGPLP